METKIKKTIAEWLPEVVAGIDTEKATDYEVLKCASEYALKEINSPEGNAKALETFKVISMLYTEEHAYARHCIENEFICNFIENSTSLQFKNYINLMPAPLREAFIKTLIDI